MPLLWLRVALAFYAVGLVYALLALRGRGDKLGRLLLPAMLIGGIFHFVSLVEGGVTGSFGVVSSAYGTESLLAFLLVAFFFGAWLRFRTVSPGVCVFPLVFLLTLVAAVGAQPLQLSQSVLHGGWIFTHVALIFLGYAALIFSFVASLLYLLQERKLKSKRLDGGMSSRLPALEVIDEIGYKSLLIGFPFMTLGIITGVVLVSEVGASYLADPKVFLALLMWGVYMVLLYTRWSSGWRGRRAAYLASFAFVAALAAWAANFYSAAHRVVAP